MRTLYTLTLLTAALAAPLTAQAGPLVTDAGGGFSYTAPNGWKVTTMALSKYKIAYAKPASGFAANLNVVSEASPLSLPDYARASRVTLNARMPGCRFISQGPFVTKSGLHGIKIVTDAAPAGRPLRQTYFLFSAHGTRKLVVTASVLQAQAGQYAGVVDAAMKTFAVK